MRSAVLALATALLAGAQAADTPIDPPPVDEIGADGDRIGLVNLSTNPLSPPSGIGFDIGSNWENGATNRATRMWRMSIRLLDATVTADGRTLVRDGRILWDEIGQ